MPQAVDLDALTTGAELGRTMAQRLCDEIAQARQRPRAAQSPSEKQQRYEELLLTVQTAIDDTVRLGVDLNVGEGWCVGFVETLADEDPMVLEHALPHGLNVIWQRRTRSALPPQSAWLARRQNALDHALEALVDRSGTARDAVQALLDMGADPLAQHRDDDIPVWHTALVREAQADVQRHVDLLLARQLDIRSVAGMERLQRALDATVVELEAVLDQDQRAWTEHRRDTTENGPMRDAWNEVFQDMLDTARRIAADEPHHARPVT